MKYQKIERITQSQIKLFELFDKALKMANYDIEEDPEELTLQWSVAMLNLGTGMMELESLYEEEKGKLIEMFNKILDDMKENQK